MAKHGQRATRLITGTALTVAVTSSVWAGAWTLPAGRSWAKVTYFQQHADEWYIASAEFAGQLYDPGSRRPYR